ncbi:hypothetical protein U1Q18_003248 [Sarracenia purpurea var. burkii]
MHATVREPKIRVAPTTIPWLKRSGGSTPTFFSRKQNEDTAGFYIVGMGGQRAEKPPTVTTRVIVRANLGARLEPALLLIVGLVPRSELMRP